MKVQSFIPMIFSDENETLFLSPNPSVIIPKWWTFLFNFLKPKKKTLKQKLKRFKSIIHFEVKFKFCFQLYFLQFYYLIKIETFLVSHFDWQNFFHCNSIPYIDIQFLFCIQLFMFHHFIIVIICIFYYISCKNCFI